ncbi:hypothetical protein CC85DRAFT_314124 [Cutaneotrichosporon oleaginosum]|uniref:Uncharacterized protein n=1 Tax=Cutaneotrichosporon oleaginosum TaxID=879819 RepID=A0A0J0XD54_9TREE|nr:uncharacterized protein CC85DRAFT_314124 [Cutaneotrichosporon oleaginosum]KLT38977.1 hypothetical protein CC85DRAFT_314124 [Cutaneotrichosporon oleaginosum]TXT14669.1 hypothetical protein COLE_00862 [Cutaneotrichosporon oleaginosum]
MDTLRPPQSTPSLTSSLTSSTSSSMPSHGRPSPPLDPVQTPARPLCDATPLNPTDRLRALLRQMDSDAHGPSPARSRYGSESTPRPPPPLSAPAPVRIESEDDSPPSPPPRIHYARLRRETPQQPPAESEEPSPPRRLAALPKRASPPRRLPSRAVALRAAAAAAAAQEAQEQEALPRHTREKSAPTPLENFIASAAPPTPYAAPHRLSLSGETRRPTSMSIPEATPRARRPTTPPYSPPRATTPPRAPSSSYTPSPPRRTSELRQPPSPSPRKAKAPSYRDEEPEEPEPPRRRDRRVATPPNTSASFEAGLNDAHNSVLDLEDSELKWRDDSVESSDSSVPIDMNRGPTARMVAAEELSMSRSRKSLSAESSPKTPRSYVTAERSTPHSRTPISERSPFWTARSEAASASKSYATAERLPTVSPSLPTPAGPSKGRSFERSPSEQQTQRSPTEQQTQRSPKGKGVDHKRRPSVDASLSLVQPEASDEEPETSAAVARRNMFHPQSPAPEPEPTRAGKRRLSASRRESETRYAALKASMGADSDSEDGRIRPGQSRQDSSLLGSLWKGLPPGLRDDSSFLDMNDRPTLAELSTQVDPTLMASAMPRDSQPRHVWKWSEESESTHRVERSEDSQSTRRLERSEENESTHRFERSEESGSSRQLERSENRGSLQYESPAARDISLAKSDFDALDDLPQSSPPRGSPNNKLRQSIGKPLTLRQSLELGLRGDEPSESQLEPEAVADEGATDADREWRPEALDTTSDSWLELNAAAALNPPSPEPSRLSPPLESPARADSDTLPDTPPRQRQGIHRTLLRAATTPAPPAPAPVAPTPLRSALKGGRFEARFQRNAPASPSVRWSEEVLANDPTTDEESVLEAIPEPEMEPEPQVRPSTSPPSTPPPHLTTPQPHSSPNAPLNPEAFTTPVHAPANVRTPRPPGAWGTPLPPPGLPPSMPLPAPPINGPPGPPNAAPPAVFQTPGLPTPRAPGAWYSPARFAPARMSRLRNEVLLDDSQSSTASSEVSVHRMSFSPKRRRKFGSPRTPRPLLPETPVAAKLERPILEEDAGSEVNPSADQEPTNPKLPSPEVATPNARSPGINPQSTPQVAEPRTPHPPGAMPKDEPEDGDTSWTARIKRVFTPGPTTPLMPSTPMTPRTASRTRLAEAQDALDTASRASEKARSRVSAAQNAWRAAVATRSAPDPEPEPMPKPEPKPEPKALAPAPRPWTLWLLYLCVELLVLWAVFRVTLEYASSSAFMARSDPFGPFAPGYAVGVRLPASLAAFEKHAPPSANVFDLLDALGLGMGALRWAPPT